MDKKDVYVIIPGLNEEKHIKDVIYRTINQGFQNVIFVDDGSNDDSVKKAVEAGAIVLSHKVNLGKGAAVKTGADYAIIKGAKALVLIDSDGQHRPEEIQTLLKHIEKYDVVLGYRKFNKNMPVVMRFGNWFLTLVTQILFKMPLKDTQSGFRVLKTEAYKKIKWHSRDYTMETEMIANISKHKLKYKEVPISTIYHDKFKGTTPLHGIKIMFNMLRFKLF